MSSSTRPSNFLLQKQKSLLCEPVNHQPSTTRDRRIRFQRQYSADQSTNTRDLNGIGFTHRHRRTNHLSYQTKCKTLNNNGTWNQEPSPESSLRIFTAFKSKNQVNGFENLKNKCVSYLFLFCRYIHYYKCYVTVH